MASTAVVPEFLTLDAARARVLAAATAGASETVPLDAVVGRALRGDVAAPHALPPFRNSSMDGFALRAADGASPRRVVETIAAGHLPQRGIGAGEAARIMTGAMLPDGADAVLPIEEAEVGDTVRPRIALEPGLNIRGAGRDVEAGTVVLREGRELSAHDLGLLGALGIASVAVGRRPTAAVISTGDELLDVDAPLAGGAIRDSNLPMLAALLNEAGARVVDARRVGDAPEAVGAAIRAARAAADVVLTIGGVSAGDVDPVKQSLAEGDDIALWRVAMKPGRPQAFGGRDGRLFFGLPGNPASVACVFEVLVRPALRALQGFAALDRPRLAVRAAEPIASRAGRTDFVRVRLVERHGEWWALTAGEQISGHLTPQSRAHALLEIAAEAPGLERGERAPAILLRWPEPTDA